ncbi:MAG TPA: hypothetical protein PLY01_08395, partial [Caldisericia bacterium]|nr:hypothetical protein [Caldisericia bacterium]
AIDEVRQAAATSSQAFMEANSAAQNYLSSGTSKIKDLQIQIAEAEGNTAKARELRIQAIRDEAAATKELIEEKVMLLNIELTKARSEAGIIGRTYLDLDKKIQEEIAWVKKNQSKALQNNLIIPDLGNKIEKAIAQIYKEIESKAITKSEELNQRIAELTTIQNFGGGLIGMAWQKNIKAALEGMLDVIPGRAEADQTVADIQTYIDKLKGKIKPLEATTNEIIALTQKLWAIQDEQKKRQEQAKKPTVTPTVPEPKIPELDINKYWAKKLVEWSKVYAAMPVEKLQPALDTLAQRLNRATENSLKGAGIDLSFYTEKIRKEMTVAATAMGEDLGKQATNYDSYKTIMDTLIAKRDELSKKTDAGSKMELEAINLVIDALKDEKDAIDAVISSYIHKGKELIYARMDERDALLDTRTALEKRQDATNKQFDALVKLAKEQGNYNDKVKDELDLQRQSALNLDKEIEATKEKLELEKKIKALRDEYAKQAEADAKKAQQDAIKAKYTTPTDWVSLEQDIERILLNPLLKVETTLESMTEKFVNGY